MQMAAANEQAPVQEPENGESSGDDDEESNPSTDGEGGAGDGGQVRTRSGRAINPPDKLTMMQMHLHTQADHPREEHSIENARIIAMVMC